jgi:hypothetical protein
MTIKSEVFKFVTHDDFCDVFSHVESKSQFAYIEGLDANKCQLFTLTKDNEIAYLITSITKVFNVTFFNILELAGDFGYAKYPQEFFDLVTEMGKKANADELRVMVIRDGGVKILKQYDFELKYAEYGINLK